MERLLALDQPPSAVCCVSDVVAIGAMRAIRQAGYLPGREISHRVCDGLEIGSLLDPPLTTMSQPLQSAGSKLAEMLITIVEGKSRPTDNQELFRASLVRRERPTLLLRERPESRGTHRQFTKLNFWRN